MRTLISFAHPGKIDDLLYSVLAQHVRSADPRALQDPGGPKRACRENDKVARVHGVRLAVCIRKKVFIPTELDARGVRASAHNEDPSVDHDHW